MTKLFTLRTIFALIMLTVISAQASLLSQQNASPSWFTSVKMTESVLQISDNGIDNMYLIIGKQKAMLIDNGTGLANIRDYVKGLTKLPVIVVITHGHPDHAGGNYQFKEVNIHPYDMTSVAEYNILPKKSGSVASFMGGGAKVSDSDVFKDTLNHQPTRMIPLSDGQIFDLGGRRIEVIFTPGHTPGEICLLDKENRMLFTGDNDNGLVWLHTPDSRPLEIYLQSLEKLNTRAGEFDNLYPGHGNAVDKAFIAEQITCVKSILGGTCVSKDYDSFVGKGKICTYKRATVAFNPDNLHIKK
jgi:glyoxylase-like metal-dependent hydrolase (beta-lactamase superfamily II)